MKRCGNHVAQPICHVGTTAKLLHVPEGAVPVDPRDGGFKEAMVRGALRPVPLELTMPTLFSLSYLLKPPWPHNPFNIVMEETPSACDLYIDRSFCCSLSGSDDNQPGHRPEARDAVVERRVLEVIASFLSGCHGRPCHALDFGANNGWMTLAMLGMGAAVTSVEPQPDLAAAVRASATLNCHGARSTVLNVYACPSYRSANWRCLRKRQPKGHWRGAGGMPLAKMGLTSDHGKMRRAATGSVPNVTGVSIEDIIYSHLTGAGAAVASSAVRGAAVADTAAASMVGAAVAIPQLAAHFDLIKMDGDGPESSWLAALEDLFSGEPRSRVSLDLPCLALTCLDLPCLALA